MLKMDSILGYDTYFHPPQLAVSAPLSRLLMSPALAHVIARRCFQGRHIDSLASLAEVTCNDLIQYTDCTGSTGALQVHDTQGTGRGLDGLTRSRQVYHGDRE